MVLFYWIGVGVQAVAGAAAIWVLSAMLVALYLWLLRISASLPDLPTDINITNPTRPETWPKVRAGLYFLIPIWVLVWCLSVAQFSAGLSAFWAGGSLVF